MEIIERANSLPNLKQSRTSRRSVKSAGLLAEIWCASRSLIALTDSGKLDKQRRIYCLHLEQSLETTVSTSRILMMVWEL
jgi:hypothetical protein